MNAHFANTVKDLLHIRPSAGERIEILQDGESWGPGTVEAVLHRNKKITGLRVRRDSGATMIVALDDVRRL